MCWNQGRAQRNPDLHAHSLGGRNAGHFSDRCALSCAWNHAKELFFIDSALIGLGLGSVQACSRTVVGLLTPKEQSAEMFGFWGFASRLSTLLGMLMGPLADYLNSLQGAVGLVTVFFVIGIALLASQDLTASPEPS